ncbi:MAG: autotransporter-associated beta strand repeat-containing protein [Kiritimatiellaeota bacterium]|nr:autotransporter-associated beta strand repeat-containing protein [Kiritimatiellota bacterium]
MAFTFGSLSAFAQWTAGEAVVISPGEVVTVSTAQPDIHSLANNGMLTVAPGGSVAVTGNAATVVGSDGMEGTMIIEGSVVKSGTGPFWIGTQGGTGIVTVASGGLLDVGSNLLYVSGNNSGNTRIPESQGFLDIAGTVKAALLEVTANFPNSAGDPYVESGVIRLLPGGALETQLLRKNDRAVSYVHFEGGALRMTVPGNFHTVGNNTILHYIIEDGCDAILDTGANNVTFNAASAGASLDITGTGGLVKQGAGTLTFTLADTSNTFTGSITVEGGTLSLGRPLYPGQQVTVHEGASFVIFAASDLPNITYLGSGKYLFTVGGDLDTLDLTTPPGIYHTDRLGGPFNGTATLKGPLTYDSANAGIPGTPFRLIGHGGTLVLTNTGLENAWLQLEGAGRFTFWGDRLYTPADHGAITLLDSVIYRQEGKFTMTGAPGNPAVFNLTGPNQFETGAGENTLEVGLNGDAIFNTTDATMNVNYLCIAGGAGVQAEFIQRGGTVNSPSEMRVGYDNGTGRLDVANGNLLVGADLRIAGGFGDPGNMRPDGTVVVSNGIIRCNTFNFTPYWPTADNTLTNLDVGRAYLLDGGVIELYTFNKNDNGTSTMTFDGGLVRARRSENIFVSLGQTLGTLVWTAPADRFVTIDTQAYTNIMPAQNGKLIVTGDGGFRKRGNGRLEFQASRADYLGDTVIEAGTFRLLADNTLPYGPGRGNLVLATAGATLDLNGRETSVNNISGLGIVTNASPTRATLGLLADDSDAAWTRPFVRSDSNIILVKQGTGTLTLHDSDTIVAPMFRIEDGTVRLGEYKGGYPFYRFKVEGIKDINIDPGCMQFSQLALLNGTENVVPNHIGVLWDTQYSDTHLTSNQIYPPAEPPDKVVNGFVPSGQPQQTNNKWLDFRIGKDRSPEDQERVWIRLQFPSAQTITAYNWGTGNDTPGRDLAAWRLQGSRNGEDWADIDVQSGYAATGTRNVWVEQDGFPVTITNACPVISPATAVVVGPGGTLEVSGGTPHHVTALGGPGSVVLDGTDLILGGADTPASFSGTISGNGNVIFDGGNQSLSADSTFTGDFTVRSGTATVTPPEAIHRWFRLTLQETRFSTNATQISEFALYAADGTRRNLGLTPGPGAAALAPSEFWTPPYALGNVNTETALGLFDNATTTKWCLSNTYMDLADPATWRTVTLRLPDGPPDEIMSYNMATANDAEWRDPITWMLESSADGLNWQLIDARTNFIPVTTRYAWYNGGAPFPIALGRAVEEGGAWAANAIPPGSVVEVYDGATLDILGGQQPISALRVDMVAGAGTITRLTPSPNGTLYLTNTSGPPGTWVIPITLGSVDTPGALLSWQIIADGTPLPGYRLSYDPLTGILRLVPQGTILMIR